MKIISFLICILITTIGFSQINTFYIEPILTEPNYSAVQDSHMVIRNTVNNNDKLFLFIGGSNYPYNSSHCLYITQPPGFAILNHNAPIKLSAINNVVWEYMLTSETSTNIEEIEKNHLFSIYPNPANLQLNVQLGKNMLGKTFYVRNTVGQTIWSGTVNDSTISLSLTNLVAGAYFFSIENQTSMFIKE